MVNRYLTIHAMQKGGEKIVTAVFFATTTFVMMMRWTTTLIAKKNIIGRYMYFQFPKCCLWIFYLQPKLLWTLFTCNTRHQIEYDCLLQGIYLILHNENRSSFLLVQLKLVLYFVIILEYLLWICYLHVFQTWML